METARRRETLVDDPLTDIAAKVERGERLTYDDGVRLYHTTHVDKVFALANRVREQKNGNKAYYVINMHLNYSNICVDTCMFCAFGKRAGEAGAYEMDMAELMERASFLKDCGPAEVHIVGGLHPDLPYSYYMDMVRNIRAAYPNLHIKAFTAVEIHYLAKLTGKSVGDVLADMKAAGVHSIPGGGAEIFAERARKKICADKISADEWLDIHRQAHRMGFRTNSTMLAGHIETLEERVDHLMRLRALQDETKGFMALVPLVFHPDNTQLHKIPMMEPEEILLNIAVSRLMLDNFDHIKAYWIQVGPELSEKALSCGADDFDGTILEERITHMAGARSPKGLGENAICERIRKAGRVPVRRDCFYNELVNV
ncbi:MAG TPA: aminofutalosine synthase MqnE [Candidatus Xenobia bacterium]